MENTPMSRRFLAAVVAIIGLTAGAYLMPQVNPFFASRPQLTRGEARSLAENYVKQQGFDVDDFFCDALFAYDVSGLDYLMGLFGVKPVLALSRVTEAG